MTATPSKPIPEAYIEVSGAVTILDFWKAVAASVMINSRTGFMAVGEFVAGILKAKLTLHLWSSPAGALPTNQTVYMTGSGTVNVGVKKGEFADISGIPYLCNCHWVYPWWGIPYPTCDSWCTDHLPNLAASGGARKRRSGLRATPIQL